MVVDSSGAEGEEGDSDDDDDDDDDEPEVAYPASDEIGASQKERVLNTISEIEAPEEKRGKIRASGVKDHANAVK